MIARLETTTYLPTIRFLTAMWLCKYDLPYVYSSYLYLDFRGMASFAGLYTYSRSHGHPPVLSYWPLCFHWRWFCGTLIYISPPNSQWNLNGVIIYRFHKMFQSTWWWLGKELNFAVWFLRDLDVMDLPCQRLVLCHDVKSFKCYQLIMTFVLALVDEEPESSLSKNIHVYWNSP